MKRILLLFSALMLSSITLWANDFVAKPFSISEDKTITFSPGNLQYHAANNEWRFAPNQTDYIGENNTNISPTYNGWIDLFGFGTGENPTNASRNTGDYSTFVDWGVNKIGNDVPNTWRTLTKDEWVYIIQGRTNAEQLIATAQVNGVNGLIILPDNWICPNDVTFKYGFAEERCTECYGNYQLFNELDWEKLEASGAVFFPAAGSRDTHSIWSIEESSFAWTTSVYNNTYAYGLAFHSGDAEVRYHSRFHGLPVRLAKEYIIHTLSFDANGGSGSISAIEIGEDESISIPTNTFNREDYKFTSWNTKADGTGTSYTEGQTISLTENITLYAQWKKNKISGNANGHEYVDLGLPSGTLWATCNVGANTPEEYGDYFAWGETQPKDYYHWETYKLSAKGSHNSMTKYCFSPSYGTVDNINILELSDDAANANWGGDWRMPTIDNFSELTTECEWSLVTKDGIRGFTVTGKNGKTIFLPEAGHYLGDELSQVGLKGAYWSSNLGSHDAYSSCFYIGVSQEVKISGYDRCRGYSIRPILPKEIVIEPEKPITYTISFHANGGSGSMSAIEIGEDESISIPTNTFNHEDYKFTGWNTKADGTGTSYTEGQTISLTENITLYAQWEENKISGNANGHDYVDLGLPSGTLWATCNVGANTPEEYGDYFAWGETQPKEVYNWSTYKYCNGSYVTITKYNDDSIWGIVDNKTFLELEDDAAHANWDGDWRMPTIEEQIELIDNCTFTCTVQNGVNGCIVTSKKNGNSIFLPAAGARGEWYDEKNSTGIYGFYWSRSLLMCYAGDGFFYEFRDGRDAYIISHGSVGDDMRGREVGQSVRPVLSKKEESVPTIIDETSALSVYAKESTIYCDEEFKIYTVSGLDVTFLNGSLQGIYVVKTEKGNKLICVR